MSDTDNTFECAHCQRSIPVGHQCNCLGAIQDRKSAGHPNAVVVQSGPGDKYDVEIVDDHQE